MIRDIHDIHDAHFFTYSVSGLTESFTRTRLPGTFRELLVLRNIVCDKRYLIKSKDGYNVVL